MTRANVRRLGAAGLLFACLIALPGQAGADDAQKLSITGPATVNEGATATYTVSLTDGTDADATVKFDAAPSGRTSAGDSQRSRRHADRAQGRTGVNVHRSGDAGHDGRGQRDRSSCRSPIRCTRRSSVRDSVTTTIIDDDTPALSIDNASADDEGGVAHFTISPSQPSREHVTVTVNCHCQRDAPSRRATTPRRRRRS